MAKISIQTSQNVTIDYELASLGDRIKAYLIDGLVIAGYAMTLTLFFIILAYFLEGMIDSTGKYAMAGLMLVLLSPLLLYNLLSEIFLNGQTIGKRQMKIKVIKINGSQPTIGAYILRWLLRPIDVMLYGIIAILCIVIGGKGQRLGDIAAGTTMVRLKEMPKQLSHQLLSNMPESYQPVYPEVLHLQDADIALITEAIEVYRTSRNNKPVLMAAERIKSGLGISNDQPPLIFLEQIVKDYNYATAVA